jgi:hypothetical protein
MDTQIETMLEGVRCTWFGTPDQASNDPVGGDGKVCPFCAQPLVERDRAAFQKRITDFEGGTYAWPIANLAPDPDWAPRPHANFSKMYAWAATQNRCFKHFMHMVNAFKKYTGESLDVTP